MKERGVGMDNEDDNITSREGGREGSLYWQDDHREMLSRSHGRTVNNLRQQFEHYDADVEDEYDEGISHRNPREQILPSLSFMMDEVRGAKKRSQDLKRTAPQLDTKSSHEQDESVRVMRSSKFQVRDVEENDLIDNTTWSHHQGEKLISGRMIICVSAFLVVLVGTFVSLAVPTTRKTITSLVLPGGGARRVKAQSRAMSAETRVSRHNLQLSIFGGISTSESEGPLPSLEGKFSPSYYPLYDTIPVLWLIPHSGSNAAMDIMSYCDHLVLANEKASNYQNEEKLEVITYPDNIAHYANVDTTTIVGLERADRLGLIESGLANVIATPHFSLASELFLHKVKTGRAFAMFRNPVKRTIAEFVAQRDLLPDHPDYIPGLSHLEVYQYAESKFVRENVMVRALANVTMLYPVTEGHVEVAKRVLEHYLVVGLSEDFKESMERFYHYFSWARRGDWKTCQGNFIAVRDYTKDDDAIVSADSNEYKTLADRNWADMQLYEHALHVYSKQGRKMGRQSTTIKKL